MLTGPEVTRLVHEFEYTQHVGRDSKHHEQTSSVQIEFQKNVKDMIRVIEEMENLFLDNGNDLRYIAWILRLSWIYQFCVKYNLLKPVARSSMISLFKRG